MINILFVNSIQKQCGCYDYGVRSFNILKVSKKYNFVYCEPDDAHHYALLCNVFDPAGVIFNYHPLTMPWVPDPSGHPRQTSYFIHHEGSKPGNLHPDYWLDIDSTLSDAGNIFSLPRPIIEKYDTPQGLVGIQKLLIKSSLTHPIISTFGFAFGSKGLGRVVKMVNEQFDSATIRIHIPRAHYGDRDGEATAGVVPGCKNEMKKDGVALIFSDVFLTDVDLLSFLNDSDLNVFLYDEMPGRGLSSVIDYALSVDTPLAINSSDMFRHIQKPEINVSNKTLQEIIDQGTAPLQEFRELWSNENFLKKYEYILDTTL